MAELDSIFSDDWGEDHRSGVVAVAGRPNVGKSTLINAILGQKIAIVSAKPQTTRQRQLGIHTSDAAQILFVDTPGLHEPKSRLGDYMFKVARNALTDADAIVWIVDVSRQPIDEDRRIAELLTRMAGGTPLVLALNKVDLVARTSHPDHLALAPHHAAIETNALKGQGVAEVLSCLPPLLPRGPRYYPADQASEANLRFMAAEIIREKVIGLTSDEIPHAVAVLIDEFKERSGMTRIAATIYVERQSQKGILIGKGGKMIKRIGTEARAALQELLACRVRLDTRVKVQRNWRGDDNFLRRAGYFLTRGKGR